MLRVVEGDMNHYDEHIHVGLINTRDEATTLYADTKLGYCTTIREQEWHHNIRNVMMDTTEIDDEKHANIPIPAHLEEMIDRSKSHMEKEKWRYRKLRKCYLSKEMVEPSSSPLSFPVVLVTKKSGETRFIDISMTSQ